VEVPREREMRKRESDGGFFFASTFFLVAAVGDN
jgi:hypothetical protein